MLCERHGQEILSDVDHQIRSLETGEKGVGIERLG